MGLVRIIDVYIFIFIFVVDGVIDVVVIVRRRVVDVKDFRRVRVVFFVLVICYVVLKVFVVCDIMKMVLVYNVCVFLCVCYLFYWYVVEEWVSKSVFFVSCVICFVC